MFLTWYSSGSLPSYSATHNRFKPQDFPSSPSFCMSHKMVQGGRNNKIPLSSGEEKHVDRYMVMNTTRNKTRTKYSKEVS